MKKTGNAMYIILYFVVFVPVVAMLILSGIAVAKAEEPMDPYDQFKPLGETSINDYGPSASNWATVTKEGMVYRLYTKPGAEFLFTVNLPKQIPFVTPGGTGIDYIVTPFDTDSSETFDNWVDVESVNIMEDNSIEIVFHINAPNNIPNDLYEFWSVTDGLDPQVGTTILKIVVDKDLP